MLSASPYPTAWDDVRKYVEGLEGRAADRVAESDAWAKKYWAEKEEREKLRAEVDATVRKFNCDTSDQFWANIAKIRVRAESAESRIAELEGRLVSCEADRIDRVEQCDRMANDWADFCASVGVTWDTQEAVACELQQRIAELEAALDEKEVASGLTSNGNLWRFWSTMASTLAVRNAELEKRLADAERVIEPFAAIIEEYDPLDDGDDLHGTLVIGSLTSYSLSIGDFRAARAYMEGK